MSEARLHAVRLCMTKTDDKIVLDFRGTDPQAPGPINWPANYAGGRFLVKWVAPVLRSLADSPERAAQLHVNEGICELFEVIFPEPGSLISPEFPAATNARSFVLLRTMGLLAGAVAHAVQGGKMPADQETIRYWGLYGRDEDQRFFLWREVLGGGSGGRHYEDGSDVIHIVPDSRNQPAEFAETRFPVIIEKLALRRDSGGAGAHRGGLGYEKDVRLLVDANLILTADRVRLGCYGVHGGRAGQPYQTIINPSVYTGDVHFDAHGDWEGARTLPGLVDGEPLRAGDVVRIVTTGGGGWGDPLTREPARVCLDVIRGLVSPEAAREHYGVVLHEQPDDVQAPYIVDGAATDALRASLRARDNDDNGPIAIAAAAATAVIDRGPGYADMVRRTEMWNAGSKANFDATNRDAADSRGGEL